MDKFIWLALLAVLIPFAMRWYRDDFVRYANGQFLVFREGKFEGAKVSVLHYEYRQDRYAPGSFYESSPPGAAVHICVDTAGQHYLWTLCHPALDRPRPLLRRLSVAEANEMLSRKESLLKELCPPQKGDAAPSKPKRHRGS